MSMPGEIRRNPDGTTTVIRKPISNPGPPGNPWRGGGTLPVTGRPVTPKQPAKKPTNPIGGPVGKPKPANPKTNPVKPSPVTNPKGTPRVAPVVRVNPVQSNPPPVTTGRPDIGNALNNIGQNIDTGGPVDRPANYVSPTTGGPLSGGQQTGGQQAGQTGAGQQYTYQGSDAGRQKWENAGFTWNPSTGGWEKDGVKSRTPAMNPAGQSSAVDPRPELIPHEKNITRPGYQAQYNAQTGQYEYPDYQGSSQKWRDAGFEWDAANGGWFKNRADGSKTYSNPDLQAQFGIGPQGGAAGAAEPPPPGAEHQYRSSSMPNLPALPGQRQAFDYVPFGFQGLPGFYQRGADLPDFSGITGSIEGGPLSGEALERATYDRGMNLLSPQFERERQQISQNLVNRGIPIGSEAYNDAMDRYDRQKGLALENLALSSVGAGRAEQSRLFDVLSRARGQMFGEEARLFDEAMARRGQTAEEQMRNYAINQMAQQQNFNQLGSVFGDAMQRRNQGLNEYLISRNQPLAELGQLMSMQRGVQMPQFQPVGQYGMGAPDIMGMTQNNYQNRMNQYNQQSGDFWGGMFGLGAAAIPLFSDRELKTDIERVGTLDNGLPVYTYRYKGHDTTHMGLMSDEVRRIRPAAVHRVGGFDAVDYREAAQ